MNKTSTYRSIDTTNRNNHTSGGIRRSSSMLTHDRDSTFFDDVSMTSSSSSSLSSNSNNKRGVITRSNLLDQLREYQVKSKHDWASVSFFSSTSNLSSSSSRMDVVVFVIWEIAVLAFFVFSAVSLYFRHLRLGIFLATITLLLLICMKVIKRIQVAQKKKRRMLLPLSM